MQANQSERKRHRKSILDFVLEDANSLQGKVSHSDRLKLDEYLTSIRDIEQRVERAEKLGSRLPQLRQEAAAAMEAHARIETALACEAETGLAALPGVGDTPHYFLRPERDSCAPCDSGRGDHIPSPCPSKEE